MTGVTVTNLMCSNDDSVTDNTGTATATGNTANDRSISSNSNSNSSNSRSNNQLRASSMKQATKHSSTSRSTQLPPSELNFSQRWTAAIDTVRVLICGFLKIITHSAATHPWHYIVGVTLISVGTLAAGLFTNFEIETAGDVLWPPQGSTTIQHQDWIINESNFAKELEYSVVFIHRDGLNLLEEATLSVERAFEVLETVQNLPDYEAICGEPYTDPNTNVTMECFQHGVVDFWWQSKKLFQTSVDSDDETIVTMSQEQFPYGRDVDVSRIYGNPEFDNAGLLTHAETYRIDMVYPLNEPAKEFLTKVLDSVLALQDEWHIRDQNSQVQYKIAILTSRSFDDEFERAIINDIPLMPAAFIVMSIFTCIVFARWDRVRSQSLLGFGAVVCVLLSVFTGYGILFIAGIPMTSATQIVVFVMFGIGLDDAFIISGSYSRTDPNKDPVERVADTIDDIGLSIALTTLTSSLAFALGAISSVTAVYWLCLYAFPTIIIDFLYMITFFLALVVIDERRMQRNKMDCLVCLDAGNRTATAETTTTKELNDNQTEYGQDKNNSGENEEQEEAVQSESLSSRFMGVYARFLAHSFVKAIVLVGFAALLGVCIYGTTQLRQAMDFVDLVPKDSHVQDYFHVIDTYSSNTGYSAMVYYRGLDQSDPMVRREMQLFLDDLTETGCMQNDTIYFWIHDFEAFEEKEYGKNNDTLTFNQKLDAFLDDRLYNSLYKDNIVRDPASGNITASRVQVHMDIDLSDSRVIQDRLKLIRSVEADQPMNQGYAPPDVRCFYYEQNMLMWEFYAVVPGELTFTTIVSVVAVSVIGLAFIPHWTAVFFVFPSIVTVYIDLLGLLYFFGVSVNPVSYITLVMSIGLLVDFIMHILLRYYECKGNREERVSETLRTMGSSILIGGISTFLGVMLLVFSSSEVFTTIFRAFIALVSLGISYGLILLPVVLSLVGPEDEMGLEVVEQKTTGKKLATSSSSQTGSSAAAAAVVAYGEFGGPNWSLMDDISDEISV